MKGLVSCFGCGAELVDQPAPQQAANHQTKQRGDAPLQHEGGPATAQPEARDLLIDTFQIDGTDAVKSDGKRTVSFSTTATKGAPDAPDDASLPGLWAALKSALKEYQTDLFSTTHRELSKFSFCFMSFILLHLPWSLS